MGHDREDGDEQQGPPGQAEDEPYFSAPEVGHHFEEPAEVGVAVVQYYDAAGRTVRTEFADGSYSRVEFAPWEVATYDQNDTAAEGTPGPPRDSGNRDPADLRRRRDGSGGRPP